MKNKKEVVYAFIDSQNVNLSIQKIGWRLDFRKFRIYLRDKYKVKKAFLFLGYIPENQKLYTALKEYGFTLVFKPTLMNKDGLVKGNCDAELVLHAMIEFEKYDKAIIVTGDGDFYCLVKYLLLENKLLKVFIPNFNTHLRHKNWPYFTPRLHLSVFVSS